MRLAADVGYQRRRHLHLQRPLPRCDPPPDFATVAPIFHAGRARRMDRRLGTPARHRRDGSRRLLDQGGRHAPGRPAHAAGQAGRGRPRARGRATGGSSTRCAIRWSGSTCAARSPRSTRAARGSLELIEAWGVDTVKAVMQRSIEHARDKLAARLAELPDGEWRDVQYIDHDGHAPKIYRIVCTMRKEGSRLDVRLRGHEPERARADQLAPSPGCRPRCCRPSTSISAGTFRGIAACAIASTSAPSRARSITPPIPRRARWRRSPR